LRGNSGFRGERRRCTVGVDVRVLVFQSGLGTFVFEEFARLLVVALDALRRLPNFALDVLAAFPELARRLPGRAGEFREFVRAERWLSGRVWAR
jgi:hypothetical protein